MSQSEQNLQYFKLNVLKVCKNTDYAVNIDFEIPHNLLPKFIYSAGNHSNLEFEIEGQKYYRTYSICSSPSENSLQIAVKRQDGGIVSNYINNAVIQGTQISISAPFGNFFDQTHLKNKENIVLWAGGSGITPILSILKYCLATDKKINIQLVFSNSSQKNIMFLEELNSLVTKFSNFQIKHIISHSEQNNFLIKSLYNLFSRSEADIKESQILNGRLDINKIKSLLPSGKTVHYICGPISMMEFCEKSLIELGSDSKDIHLEYFVTKKENDVLYSTGEKVPKTGNYICINCGFVQHFQNGEKFTVCPVCLAGEDDPDYELWKFHE